MLRIRVNARGRAGRRSTVDEMAVLAALEMGEAPKDIAARLKVALSTVHRARDRALRTLLARAPDTSGAIHSPSFQTLPLAFLNSQAASAS
jgi:DNA-binding NarL/FixJ family response regulator